MDIIEIDAASNRRIDEIRDLREKVRIAPTVGRYKVYIIDEVHMLTKEAFNALLKTLEEPPAHAVFILATTEIHKVPDTIISRTQRFAFHPINKDDIVRHLLAIAKNEGIQLDEAAAIQIAEHAQGGFRDAISLLDQVRHTAEHVSADVVSDALGIPPVTLLDNLWSSIQMSDGHATDKLKGLYDQGYHAPIIAKELLKRAVSTGDIDRARTYVNLPKSYDPHTELLLIALEADHNATQPSPPASIDNPAPQKKRDEKNEPSSKAGKATT
jgi:DNA polymerase III subunit gamma/tau